MAITFIDAVQPALETSNAATHSITTPSGVLAGDFLLLFVSYAGNGTNSLTTNPCGFTKLGDSTASGITSTVYYKQNTVTGDSSQATVITTSSATARVTKIIARYRGVAASGSSFLGYGQQAASSQATYASPTVATTGLNGVRVEYAAWSFSSQVANSGKTVVTDMLTAAPNFAGGSGLTKVAAHWTGSAVTTGNAEAGLGHNLTGLASGSSAAGTIWTPEAVTPSGNASTWTIILAPVAVVSSTRPTSVPTSTGWTSVGSAGTVLGALADTLDSTWAESADDPTGTQPLQDAHPPLSAQATVSVISKLSATGTSISWLIELVCNTTVICSKTRVVTVADGIVDDTLTGTAVETATIADWANLRARRTPTAV